MVTSSKATGDPECTLDYGANASELAEETWDKGAVPIDVVCVESWASIDVAIETPDTVSHVPEIGEVDITCIAELSE